MEKVEEKKGKQKKDKDKKPQGGHAKPHESKKATVEDQNFRHLVRVSGIVLDGNKEVYRAITNIRGIGRNMGLSLVRIMGIPKDRKLGTLTEDEVNNIEENILNLNKKTPVWTTNRRKDYKTGQDLHLTGSELEITQREDVTRHKKTKTYRGLRHILGQPVRGQRTRTSFRKGSAIGVSRKKAAAAAKPAPKK